MKKYVFVILSLMLLILVGCSGGNVNKNVNKNENGKLNSNITYINYKDYVEAEEKAPSIKYWENKNGIYIITIGKDVAARYNYLNNKLNGEQLRYHKNSDILESKSTFKNGNQVPDFRS